MQKIEVKSGIVYYYGNPAGYVEDAKAVIDPIFKNDELTQWMTEKKWLEVDWRKLHISQVRKKYGYKKFGVKYPSKDGEKTAYFYDGGFKKKDEPITTADVDTVPQLYRNGNRNGLIKRLKARQCEYCGAENVKIEIHHVRKLRDLQGKKQWERLMIARKRKTMALCVPCHDSLHAGRLD